MPISGDYTTFGELITEAHKRNVDSITSDLVDYEFDGEGEPLYAVVKATAVIEGHQYTGIGDATRKNCNRNIAPHLVRQAQTRAVSRALRIALGVGKTAMEELGGDIPPPEPSAPRERPRERPRAKPPQESSNSSEEMDADADADADVAPIEGHQVKALRAIVARLAGKDNVEDALVKLEEEVGEPLEMWSYNEASHQIERLQRAANRRAKAEAEEAKA